MIGIGFTVPEFAPTLWIAALLTVANVDRGSAHKPLKSNHL
jgi:hypothetical protein